MKNNPLRLMVIALFSSVAPVLFAQQPGERSLAPKLQDPIVVDYADFESDSVGMQRLEVYCQLYNAALVFNLTNGIYEANYELSTVIVGAKDIVYGSQTVTRSIHVTEELRTKSPGDYRINQANFDLPPGKYTVQVTVHDGNSQQVFTREMKLKLETASRKRPTLSGLELVQYTGAASMDSSGTFVKGDITIIPSVTRSFALGDSGRIAYYFEVYKGDENNDSDIIIESVIRSRSKMLYRDTLHMTFTSPTMRQFRQVTMTGLTPGDYELIVTLRGRRYKDLDSRSRMFAIDWTREALLKHDYETALRQLSYIADNHEIDEMEKAETYEERKQAFEQFWLERDPTPGTPDNERRDEFYRRVEVANARFGFLQTQGWRTDRGKIYIKFGEPDKIDDYPYNSSAQSYQVWHYYLSSRYLRFTFTDEIGDGDYRLTYPYDGLNERPDF